MWGSSAAHGHLQGRCIKHSRARTEVQDLSAKAFPGTRGEQTPADEWTSPSVQILILPGPDVREGGETRAAEAVGRSQKMGGKPDGLFCSLSCANVFQGRQHRGRALPASHSTAAPWGAETLRAHRLGPMAWLCHSLPVLPQARDLISKSQFSHP